MEKLVEGDPELTRFLAEVEQVNIFLPRKIILNTDIKNITSSLQKKQNNKEPETQKAGR